jgi:hypothetical protein
MYYLEILRAMEGTLSCWFRLLLQSLAPTNTQWARVVGYGSFSFCVIHKEGLCLNSGDMNRMTFKSIHFTQFLLTYGGFDLVSTMGEFYVDEKQMKQKPVR